MNLRQLLCNHKLKILPRQVDIELKSDGTYEIHKNPFDIIYCEKCYKAEILAYGEKIKLTKLEFLKRLRTEFKVREVNEMIFSHIPTESVKKRYMELILYLKNNKIDKNFYSKLSRKVTQSLINDKFHFYHYFKIWFDRLFTKSDNKVISIDLFIIIFNEKDDITLVKEGTLHVNNASLKAFIITANGYKLKVPIKHLIYYLIQAQHMYKILLGALSNPLPEDRKAELINIKNNLKYPEEEIKYLYKRININLE